MTDYKKMIETIRNARKYDTAGKINISKEREERIIEVAEQLDIEFSEAAELLLEIGAEKIDCWC